MTEQRNVLVVIERLRLVSSQDSPLRALAAANTCQTLGLVTRDASRRSVPLCWHQRPSSIQ